MVKISFENIEYKACSFLYLYLDIWGLMSDILYYNMISIAALTLHYSRQGLWVIFQLVDKWPRVVT